MIYMITSSSANNRCGLARKEILENFVMCIDENTDYYPYQDEDGNWFVEIPTLDVLMKIINILETAVVIIPNYKGDYPTLEFYDDWRETSEMKNDCTPLK